MTICYLDPSTWIKRHFREAGSDAVNALFRATGGFACCRLGLTEMTAAGVRRCHGASMDAAACHRILSNVRADYSLFRVVIVDESLIAEAERLTMIHRLWTMDAIHLACALSIGPKTETTLVSADLELLAAVGNEGLAVSNP